MKSPIIVKLASAFAPSYTTQQHVLSALRSDTKAMQNSPDTFTRIVDYISQCDSRIAVGEGPVGKSQTAALEHCVTNPLCRAVTQGNIDDPTEVNNYYICADDSYMRNFTSAKNKVVFIKTSLLVANLKRDDAIIYPNAELPSGVCSEKVEETDEAVETVIEWPETKHEIGLVLSAQVSGGGLLLWDLSSCNKFNLITGSDLKPETADNSIYIYLP